MTTTFDSIGTRLTQSINRMTKAANTWDNSTASVSPSISSGEKVYIELVFSGGSTSNTMVGFSQDAIVQTGNISQQLHSFALYFNGANSRVVLYWGGSSSGTIQSSIAFTSSDILGVTFDYDNMEVAYYKNNTLQNTVNLVTEGMVAFTSSCVFGCSAYSNASWFEVYTQTSDQTYDPPTGFVALDAPVVGDSLVAVQGSQTAEGTATKAGTLTASGTIVTVQRSQTAVGSGANVKPDNWGWAIQGGQFASGGAQITADTVKHYFATSGVTLNLASDPAGQEIPPTLQNPGNFKRDINIGDFGIVKPSFGEIVISNLNGDHDDLLTKGFDGQRATLYYGPKKGTFPGAYRKVLEATVGGVSYDQDTIRFKIKDNLEYLDRPYLQKVFTGTGGSEGDASVVGQKRQKHFGYLPYLPPQLIDAQKLIYLISDQSIYYRKEEDLLVYDGGVLITHAGLYTSAFDLENSPPAPGTVKLYANYPGPTYMRLGSSPVYDVRVSTNYVYSGASTKNDLSPQDMVAHVIGAENVSYTAERFIYGRLVRDDETIADVITDHCKLRCVNAWADRDNVFHCEPFNVIPSLYSSTYEFNQHIITSVMFEQIIPARKVVINSGEVFSGTVAGGASDTFKQDMKKTGSLLAHEVDKSDQYAKHRLAPEAVYISRCYATEDQLNIEDDLERWGVVHDEHTIATVTIKNGFNTDLIDIDLNDIVTLTLPRFGLSAGQKCTVVGVRHDYRQNSLTFRLWW